MEIFIRRWIKIFIMRHRKAYLLTRGQKWHVRSSSNVQSLSAARSPSDGHDSPRPSSHLGDTWHFLHRTTMTKQDSRSWLTIAVRSWPDRPAIGADSAPNWEPRRRQLMGHDQPSIVAINPLPRPHQMAVIFGRNFPLKEDVFPFLFFNF